MNIKFIEYDGISGYARVMYNDVKEADKYHTEVTYEGKDIKALLEYLFELEGEHEVSQMYLNNIIKAIEIYENKETVKYKKKKFLESKNTSDLMYEALKGDDKE